MHQKSHQKKKQKPASLSFFKFSSEPDWTMPAKSVLEPKVPLPRRWQASDQGIDLNLNKDIAGIWV